jgi:RNA binding exosome subunit
LHNGDVEVVYALSELRPLFAEISVIVHATEDPEKAVKALLNVIPEHLRQSMSLTRRYATGHYGNPIITISTRMPDEQMACELLEYMLKGLNEFDRTEAQRALLQEIDPDGYAYLRFDKQAAYLGFLRLRSDDPIRVKLRLGRTQWRSGSGEDLP